TLSRLVYAGGTMRRSEFKVPEEAIRNEAALQGITRFVVNVAIVEENRLLVVRRSKFDSLPGLWELPGGGVEPGETFEQAAVRETYEEAGLKVVRIHGLFASADYFTRSNGLVRRVNLVADAPGDVTLGEAHDDARRVQRHEINQLSTTSPETRTDMFRAFSEAAKARRKRY